MFEIMTNKDDAEKQERRLWLQERQKGIGGSDIGTLIGLNKYQTNVDLYFSKVNPVQDDNGNKFTRTGKQLEDFVAKWFAQKTNLMVRKAEKENYTDFDVPYFKASVDRLINEDTILEIKTTSINTDEPLPYWIAQLQWYLGILNRPQGVIAWVTIPHNFDYDFLNSKNWTEQELGILKCSLKLEWRVIERDDYYIRELREYAAKFWNNHVIPRVPPEPINAYDAMKLYPVADSKKTREISDSFLYTINRIQNVKEVIKKYTAEKEDLETTLKIYIQDNEALTKNNKVVCTYKNQTNNRVDTDKLKADGIYNQYLKASNSRTLLIKI